mmetsp:Transcript_42450/g.89141  ORF Transcript_42450/g.89141 Transcript_42450/m.89141 type:complete len:225 (+) Transcript_42450:58-732(+)
MVTAMYTKCYTLFHPIIILLLLVKVEVFSICHLSIHILVFLHVVIVRRIFIIISLGQVVQHLICTLLLSIPGGLRIRIHLHKIHLVYIVQSFHQLFIMCFQYLTYIKLFTELTNDLGTTIASIIITINSHLLLIIRGHRIIRNLPLIPIMNHTPRRHNLIRDPTLQHPPLGARHHRQERHDSRRPLRKCRHIVRHHQTLHRTPPQQLLYRGYRILDGIGINAIA